VKPAVGLPTKTAGPFGGLETGHPATFFKSYLDATPEARRFIGGRPQCPAFLLSATHVLGRPPVVGSKHGQRAVAPQLSNGASGNLGIGRRQAAAD
jgi:hypothetical protein